jgi:excisionase family DNA binding protein
MNNQHNEFLNLNEAARMLGVSDRTLSAEAKANRVPHFKVGKQYRFLSSVLIDWARQQSRQNCDSLG